MFVEVDGPTALRPDMVHALSFSVSPTQVETSKGIERCAAAVGSVWSGSEGHVVFLLRSLERPDVRLFAFADPILSAEELARVMDEGLRFATSLGFLMERAEFRALDAEQKGERLRRWNDLRKPNKSGAEQPSPEPAPRSEARSEVATPEPDIKYSESGSAVVGRVALVRHGDDKPGPLAQLLAFF